MDRLFKNFLGILMLRDLESKLHDKIDLMILIKELYMH